jgi:hypothetical protein
VVICYIRVVVEIDLDPGFEDAVDAAELVRVTVNHAACVQLISGHDLQVLFDQFKVDVI